VIRPIITYAGDNAKNKQMLEYAEMNTIRMINVKTKLCKEHQASVWYPGDWSMSE
jgi:hypothetical protein